ncbi:MAG: ethylbenzene dehydrogenase-related protein [Planctomycetota bacterium]|jgi:hypothetical protein
MRVPALLLSLFLVGCGDEPGATPEAPSKKAEPTGEKLQRLNAYRLPAELSKVRIDGNAGDVGWRRAREIKIPLAGSDGDGPDAVTVKAIYSDVGIYFLLIWHDEKIDQNNLCRYEKPGRWKMLQGEDALMLLFPPPELDGEFRASGFDLFVKDGAFAHPGAKGFADAWYWGVQTTRPTNQARDHWLRPNQRLRGDSQPDSSDNIPNWNAVLEAPAGVPRKSGGRAVSHLPVRASIALTKKRLGLMKSESNFGWTVPAVLSRPMLGSRGDVTAAARWSKATGTWIMEIARKLDTGHQDDRILGESERSVPMALAIWDGTAEGVHPGQYGVRCTRSRAFELVFLSES